jgi:hypothetical protein
MGYTIRLTLTLTSILTTAVGCSSGAPRSVARPDARVDPDAGTARLDGGPPVDAGVAPSGDVGRYQVHEITVAAASAPFANPWEETALQAELTAPSGARLTVPGFYYDVDTWKLRFVPAEVGRYVYTYTLTGPAGQLDAGEGAFEVGDTTDPGFLRAHPTNPYRLVYERGGALFSGQGFSGCLRDPESQRFPTPWEDKGFCIDKYAADDTAACGKTWSEYLERHVADMRPSLYRWNVNACSFPLWSQLETAYPNGVAQPNNVYDVRWGKWGDRVAADLRARGVRILMSPVGFGWQRAEYGNKCGPNYDQDCTAAVCGARGDLPCTAHNAGLVNTNDVAALQRYFTYIVARYGAYVDVWELINEYPLPDAAVTTLARHIRSIDPYDHPVTISWTRPDHPEMELTVPHVYQRSDAFDVDLRQADALVAGNLGPGRVYPKDRYPMPIIAGEIGEPFGTSTDPNFEANVREGTRIKLWSAFFMEAGLVLWESSLSGARQFGGVTFLGPELRRAFRAHEAFVAQVPSDVTPLPMVTLRSGGDTVRAYALRGPSAQVGYLVHPTRDVTAPARAQGFELTLDAPAAGTLRWLSPADGSELGRVEVQAGLQTLPVPVFEIDLAYALVP